jgi:hypothetical protein
VLDLWIRGLACGTPDARMQVMLSTSQELVRTHRVDSAKREAAWQQELEARRQVIASRCSVDLEALRHKLGV